MQHVEGDIWAQDLLVFLELQLRDFASDFLQLLLKEGVFVLEQSKLLLRRVLQALLTTAFFNLKLPLLLVHLLLLGEQVVDVLEDLQGRLLLDLLVRNLQQLFDDVEDFLRLGRVLLAFAH